MNKNIFFIFIFLSLFSVSNLHAKTSPSFDCSKASTEIEKLICSDEELSKLDVEMNDWYRKVIRWQKLIANTGVNESEKSHEKWLSRRSSLSCIPKVSNKKECLVSLHREAIQVYKNRLLRLEFSRVCNWGGDECKFDYIDKLITEGADLNGYGEFYGSCWSGPVYFAAFGWNKKEVFDYILEHGADFNQPIRDDCKGYTQVLDAGRINGSAFEFFSEIMALNPDLDYKKDGEYLFLLARRAISKGGGREVENEFLYRVKSMLSYDSTLVNLSSSKLYNDKTFKNYIYSKGDNVLIIIFKYTAESDFFRYDRVLNLVKYLVNKGVNVTHKNNEGYDALYYLEKSKNKFTPSEYKKLKRLIRK